jgi:hypothetical protein
MNEDGRWPVFVGTWQYQSILVDPSRSATSVAPGGAVPAATWAKGVLEIGDSVGPVVLNRTLTLVPGVSLQVNLRLSSTGGSGQPFALSGEGIGVTGPLTGARYELSGWALVKEGTGNEVGAVFGAIRAVRGTDKVPGQEPGGAGIPSVGFFRLTK